MEIKEAEVITEETEDLENTIKHKTSKSHASRGEENPEKEESIEL